MRDGHDSIEKRCDAYREGLQKIFNIAQRKEGADWDLVLAAIADASLPEHPTSERTRALRKLVRISWGQAWALCKEHPWATPAELAEKHRLGN